MVNNNMNIKIDDKIVSKIESLVGDILIVFVLVFYFISIIILIYEKYLFFGLFGIISFLTLFIYMKLWCDL